MATSPTPRPRTAASAGAGSTRRSTGSGGRRPTRSASSGSNSMPMVLGGVGVLVVVVALVLLRPGGGSTEATGATPGESAQKPAAVSQPAAAPVQLAAAKAGKTPARPAPALTQEMLGKLRSLTATASALFNEGVKARNAGDNTVARDKQAQAKESLDQVQTLLADQLLWQEEAQMEGWAQPAEYITLEREYNATMSLTKKVRMQGGK